MASDQTHAAQPPSPFAELSVMYQRLCERELHQTIDGSMVGEMFRAANLIDSVHHLAAEMQLGAEGFDNTGSARLYAEVQDHLLAAARELVAAAAILTKEVEFWANLKSQARNERVPEL